MSQKHKDVTASFVLAVDKLDAILALQQLLNIALEQMELPHSLQHKQARTELLLNCYLEQVKQPLQDLHQELEALRQLNHHPQAIQSLIAE